MHGGEIIGRVLKAHGVRFLFTLCGGHISPILSGSKQQGIRVIDTRHEATAVFAADAVARLSGVPGVAAVTAGPGVTNTLTAIQNARLAQSPVVILGGATATVLRGRGSLQDIDQLSLLRSSVKWLGRANRVRDLEPMLREAFRRAVEGVPGPVFLECPVDLLYAEPVVRELYGAKAELRPGAGLADRALAWYLKAHLKRQFAGVGEPDHRAPPALESQTVFPQAAKAAAAIAKAERPVMVIGSQALLDPKRVVELQAAIERLGMPVYLSGMARGLLGVQHPLQYRHKRRDALREADLVLLAGVPSDFRLDYGAHMRRNACLISVNRSRRDLMLNRRPGIAVLGDPASFITALADACQPGESRWAAWHAVMQEREQAREADIDRQASVSGDGVNPLQLFKELDRLLPDETVLVADGGDFVATASYIVWPRGPLRWLDPGVFGTLGVGAGFALGAKLCYPESEVWALFGDGALGYSLMEFDTFVRHGIPVIAVVGNDACWTQIAREQVEVLNDDVGCMLRYSDYHEAAAGLGAGGLALKRGDATAQLLQAARAQAAAGTPVLVNAYLGKTDFRKGSISM